MTVYSKLAEVQKILKCNKSQWNDFGKYHYRSCEDILEAVKPVCYNNNAVLTLTDSVELIGDRFYIKATATFVDIETGETVSNSAYAREDTSKKGMDGSQITGTASSYARKYCLNGLFCIDDTKDADTNEYRKQTTDKPANIVKAEQMLGAEVQPLYRKNDSGEVEILTKAGAYKALSSFTLEQLNKMSNSKTYEAIGNEVRKTMMEMSKK